MIYTEFMRSRLSKNSWILTRPAAHRGLHNETIPENSLSAFSAAVEKGYPIETDVHMSIDDRLVCFHDDNVFRMTGLNRDIRDLSYSEIKSLNLNATSETIPDFEEFLQLVGGKVPLLIEIKQQKRKGIVDLVLKALKSYNGEYAIQSFDPTVIIELKKKAPEILRGQLASGKPENMNAFKKYIVKNTPLNFLSRPDFVNYDLASLPTRKSRYSGLPLICWTVRTTEERKKAEEIGVNYVFENVFN